MSEDTTEGLGRRDLLKRGAILGGTVAWMAPAVQTLAAPAFAAGSPASDRCSFRVDVTVQGGGAGCVNVSATTADCCRALTAAIGQPDPATRFLAIINALIGPACSGVGTITNC